MPAGSTPPRTSSAAASCSAVSATRWVLEQGRPSAVVGLSDVLAIGALDVLAAHGLAAGADVSVCGFDDITAAAERGLTTVRQPVLTRGREVGRLLLDPDSEPRQVLLPIELVPRTSTGPARS